MDITLGHGDDAGRTREQQGAAQLIAIDLLRILDDLDLALEHALRGAVENALVDLPAVILRDEVTGDRRRVGMLLTANEIGAVQDAVGIAALKPRLQLIARELRAG